MATANLDTLVPTGPDPKLGPDREFFLAALDRLGKMGGKGGPGMILAALFAGALGGIAVLAMHSRDGGDLARRIEALEKAATAADEHNAWVQDALTALSESKPLPPRPYRRMAP
jgi:hypothetical protein